jgi:hypothetical protein
LGGLLFESALEIDSLDCSAFFCRRETSLCISLKCRLKLELKQIIPSEQI